MLTYRINTMPLIRRGVYSHCLGCRRGKPYEIGHITKVDFCLLDLFCSDIFVQGATLQFETKNHPNLSDNLSLHNLLTVKVSFVDEQMKRQLLYVCISFISIIC